MNFFANSIVKPFIVERGYRVLCEVGASYGDNTAKLLETNPSSVVIIDPCVDANLEERYRLTSTVAVYKGLSLEVLPKLTEQFDCILVDGDHNWYTVYNELRLIEERKLLRIGGAIFLHDVCWPYGRRDMYYQPETIPAEFIQRHAKKGIIRSQSNLTDRGGINAVVYNALVEGGRRNGVKTAIEDFMELFPEKYLYLSCHLEFGLGLLFKGTGLFARLSLAKWFVIFKYPKLSRRIAQ